jgi:hypothetical protein
VVVPAASTLERLALIARAQARRVAHKGLIRDLTPEQEAALMYLIDPGEQGRTGLGWIREWSEAPTAANFKAVVERLDRVRSLEVEPERARRIHAARYAVIARVAGIVTAQALRRMERRRRLATLVAFAIELEAALTDAALLMVEKMVGSLLRRADRTRSERLLGEARLLKDTARVHARLGRLLIEARASGRDPLRAIDDRIGWELLERSVRFAEELTRGSEDGLEEVVQRYPEVRRFAPTLFNAFTFRAARPGDPLLGAVDALRRMYRDGRSVLPKRVPTTFLRPRWRKVVFPGGGEVDRRAYEVAVIIHLRERLASGGVWVDGSRAYRTLDDYLLPEAAYVAMRDEGGLDLAVPSSFADWHTERRAAAVRRMSEVERAAAAGELFDVVIAGDELTVSPLRRAVPDEADELKIRLYALLPRVRVTDLLVEVAAWSGFADAFVHARSGEPASDQAALMGTILADATNLGLGRMAESSRGLTLSRLRWTAEWHVRDETSEIARFAGNSRSDWFLALIEQFPTPATITALDREAFSAAAWPLIGRKVSKARLINDIYETASASTALPVPEDSAAITMFRMVIAQGRSLIHQRDEIERLAHARLTDDVDYQLLRNIPGIGPINALTILAEAGDLRRFNHHRQFLKFCGLDLATCQSGTFRGRTKLSKERFVTIT